MDNKTLIAKADIAVSDLTTNGGYLNPEQSNAFIRKLLVQPTLLKQARSVTMTAPKRDIDKIGFGTRILHAAPSSGTALDSTKRSKPTTEKVSLSTKEVIAEVNLPYDVIEDNIERGLIGNRQDVGGQPTSGGLRDTIMDLIAERAALDLEELALLGDTSSSDPYLAQLNGFLKQATSNVVDATGVPIDKSLFKEGLQAMPDQYLRNRVAMRHFLSVDNELEYRDYLGNRNTTLGDAMIQGVAPVFGMGVPVQAAALMPSSDGLLLDPTNMVFGIQRQISIETDKDIRARVYIIVLTARIDFVYEEEEAVVHYKNLNVAAPATT